MIYRVVEKMYLYYFAVSQNVDKPRLFVYVYKGRVKPKWVFILRYKSKRSETIPTFCFYIMVSLTIFLYFFSP